MANQLLILILSFCALHVVSSIYTEPDVQNWKLFKKKYSKSYADKKEESSRMETFLKQLNDVKEHNKLYDEGKVSYKEAINQYSDMPFEEFIKQRGLNVEFSLRYANMRIPPENMHNSSKMAAATSINWRERGAVTRVKNQYNCGSCWAFSATGALEGQTYRKTGRLIELSEQNLIDCTKALGNGCHGGWMDVAFNYVKQNGGIAKAVKYPYRGDVRYLKNAYNDDSVVLLKEGHFFVIGILQDNYGCQYHKSHRGAGCIGYKRIPKGSESNLKNAVSTVGPISITMELSRSFYSYGGGVWNDTSCSQDIGFHAMLLVGYGTTRRGEDYWLVKNSWGCGWGDNGYIKVARTGNNLCGIADYGIYPLV